MWTLFIISFPLGFDEAKFTMYQEFDSLWDCNNAVVELEKKFTTDSERAFCLKTGKTVPRIDSLY